MDTRKQRLLRATKDSVVGRLNAVNEAAFMRALTRRSKVYHEEVIQEKTKYY
jgi:hypothetical protein